jgi:signal transduction histidine kinase
VTYLQERVSASHLATLALEAAPDHKISAALERELLDHAGAFGITLYKPGQGGELMLSHDMPPAVDARISLEKGGFFGLIGEAFAALTRRGPYILKVMGPSPRDPGVLVEVTLDEAPMRRAMVEYSERILVLSLVISAITAALVYLSLQWLLVLPMRRMTENMTAFRENPEDPGRVINPSARTDEIGVAQRVLAGMEEGLRGALRERARLAALGAGVARINHDLRNILATARLVSDRIAMLADPTVKRLAPTLVAALDRAVELCARTVDFARADASPRLTRFALAPLVSEAGAAVAGLQAEGWRNDVPSDLEVEADRDQLFRALSNLGANAFEAGAASVVVRARREDGTLVMEIADDGPGIAPAALDTLFQPFGRSSRAGGTGLGLAIAREIVRAHGGELELAGTGPGGTTFR